MNRIIKTNSRNPDFLNLVTSLDAELAVTDGEEHAFYDQFNKVDTINFVVVFYINEQPVGCGAIKEFDTHTMEVKRMYVSREHRGKNIASKILAELEGWAFHMNYKYCILETGIRQPDAIALYQKNGYELMPNYGQYEGVKGSLCYKKPLIKPY